MRGCETVKYLAPETAERSTGEHFQIHARVVISLKRGHEYLENALVLEEGSEEVSRGDESRVGWILVGCGVAFLVCGTLTFNNDISADTFLAMRALSG